MEAKPAYAAPLTPVLEQDHWRWYHKCQGCSLGALALSAWFALVEGHMMVQRAEIIGWMTWGREMREKGDIQPGKCLSLISREYRPTMLSQY